MIKADAMASTTATKPTPPTTTKPTPATTMSADCTPEPAQQRARAPVALVTAGSAGLGAAAARLFARQGYRVAVNYAHNDARADALVAELRALSPLPLPAATGKEGEGEGGGEGKGEEGGQEQENFIAVRADLGVKAQVVELVRQTVERLGGGRFFGTGPYEGSGESGAEAEAAEGAAEGGALPLGRLDAVFSNGGWTQRRSWQSLDANADDDDWDRAFAVNVKAHLWLLRAARPHLDRGGDDGAGGAFVSTASLAGVSVSGSSMAYAVTKAAQIHLVRCLAVVAAPNIRVNCVSPGLLLTDWSAIFPENVKEDHRQKTKLKRVVTVEDVAEQVFTFVKTKSMTGVNVVMDAGYTLQG